MFKKPTPNSNTNTLHRQLDFELQQVPASLLMASPLCIAQCSLQHSCEFLEAGRIYFLPLSQWQT